MGVARWRGCGLGVRELQSGDPPGECQTSAHAGHRKFRSRTREHSALIQGPALSERHKRDRETKQNVERQGPERTPLQNSEMLSHLYRLKGKGHEKQQVKGPREEAIGGRC